MTCVVHMLIRSSHESTSTGHAREVATQQRSSGAETVTRPQKLACNTCIKSFLQLEAITSFAMFVLASIFFCPNSRLTTLHTVAKNARLVQRCQHFKRTARLVQMQTLFKHVSTVPKRRKHSQARVGGRKRWHQVLYRVPAFVHPRPCRYLAHQFF